MNHRVLVALLMVFTITTTTTTTSAFILDRIGKVLQTGSDVITSGINTGKSIAEKIPDLIPTPDSILTLGKEALLGLPFQVFFSALNQVCSVALAGNQTKTKYTPDVKQLGFVLITTSNNVTVPLLEPDQLWANPLFDHKLPTALFITGWTSDLKAEQDTTIDTVYNGYKARGEHNFVVLDPAEFIDTLYSWSAFNTEEIGQHVGNALAKLTKVYPKEKIHVIGHSLGAQIAGATGRQYYAQKNELLPRITGLDPANPCFNEGEALTGLYRGDAEFVDVIHTNNGVLGVQHPIGDADFYPNGVSVLQPGCYSIVCAHARSWQYYAETVYPGNEQNFLAQRCNSLAAQDAGLCPGASIPMGYKTPKNVRGNYFLKTGDESPYGLKNNST